jgi:predicted MFS family arabinose efflux permease
LFILAGLNLFNYLDRYVVYAVVEPVKLDFGLTDGQAGRINTAFMIGYFLTAPLFGYLGDRMARKWLIAAGIFVWSLGTVLTGFAGGYVVLLAYRVLVGFGEASYATISPSLLSDAYGPSKRNNALTIFYLAIPLGAALGYLVGSQIESFWGWRYAFIAAGVPGLVLAVGLLPFREPKRGQADCLPEEPMKKHGQANALKLLRLADYNLVVWGYAAYTFAMGAIQFWGKSYLERFFGSTSTQAGNYLAIIITISGIASTFAGGFAASAWRKRNPAAYSLTLGLSTLAAVPFVAWAFWGGTKTAFIAGLAAAIFLLLLGTGPVNTLIVETVPVKLRASAMAMAIFIIHLFGDMWSPEIIGHLSKFFGLNQAVLILPAVLLLAGGLWLGLAVKTLRNNNVDKTDLTIYLNVGLQDK